MKFLPNFLDIIKYIGASYLIYIGYQTFIQKPIKLELCLAFIHKFTINALVLMPDKSADLPHAHSHALHNVNVVL